MNQVHKFLSKVYAGVGTPLSLGASLLLENGELAEIQNLRQRLPSLYCDPLSYKWDSVVIDLTRKLLLPGDAERRRAMAVKTFWDCETQCLNTNTRLTRYLNNQGPFETLSQVSVVSFIEKWRKEVKNVLGRCPQLLEPCFSGGSTLSDAGKLTTIPDKMSSVQTAYPSFTNIAYDSIQFTPLGENEMVITRGNRFFTVPKDNEKDRGCCVEASLAVSLQLAVGKHIRRLLKKRYRFDLKTAQGVHRMLAQKASCGELPLSTIDLSNASDTVSKTLVKLILPEDWFALLNSLRAAFTVIDGKHVWLNKFSSMGNGFTFELETLLFQTLGAVIASDDMVRVYGDDIIIPTEHAPEMLAALRFFGFTPNEKKTFVDGFFRESCGGDFFDGVPVRAHFLKELPDEPQKWMALANGLRRVDPALVRLHAAWRYCVDQIPSSLRVFGPRELGDLVIHDPDAVPTMRHWFTKEPARIDGEVKTRKIKHDPIPMWRIYRPVSKSFDLGKYWTYRVATAASTLGVPSKVIPRDSVTGYTLDWTPAWGLQDHSWWCGR